MLVFINELVVEPGAEGLVEIVRLTYIFEVFLLLAVALEFLHKLLVLLLLLHVQGVLAGKFF